MHNTPEIRVYASDEVKFKIVDGVKEVLSQRLPVIDIDGVRAIYPTGWGLVRASNTQGALVLRFEAETEEELKAIKEDVEQTIEDVIKKLDVE
jgi:phosphomannomutase/phosphoglucomutase